eukprot:Nk52_evm1s544 gene=Nk52_evmTU1s544
MSGSSNDSARRVFEEMLKSSEFAQYVGTLMLHNRPELVPNVGQPSTRSGTAGFPRVAKPDKFDGLRATPDEVSNFVFALQQYVNQFEFPTEAAKIIGASSYLKGASLTWYKSKCHPVTRICTIETFAEFCLQLESSFMNVNVEDNARDKLADWKQKTSVRAANMDFRLYMSLIPGPHNMADVID